jgi:hypothetical protein
VQLEPLEAAVLVKFLEGDFSGLVGLRAQLAHLTVKSRELTGVGFFTEFEIASEAVPVPLGRGISPLRGVAAKIEGLENGAGFLLFVEDGLLSMLEGFSYDDRWPSEIRSFSVELDASIRERGHRPRQGS